MATAKFLDDASTRALARVVRSGGPDAPLARSRLAEANMGLVVSLARSYRRRGLSMADLIGQGSIGLMRAIDGFDPERGARFSTYAGWWIKAFIRRGLDRAHFLPVPEWARRAVRDGRAESRQPCVGAAQAALRMTRHPGEAVYPMRLWLTDDQPAPWTAGEDAEDLHAVLAILPERERTILTLRYGMGGQEPLTAAAIGQTLNLSRHVVCQIEKAALAWLRERMESHVTRHICRIEEAALTRLLGRMESNWGEDIRIVSKSTHRKLTPKDIPVIRQLHREGQTLHEIALVFGLHKCTVCNIIKGRRWKNAQDISPCGPRTEEPSPMFVVKLTWPNGSISYVPGECLMQPESGGGHRRPFPTDPALARKFNSLSDGKEYIADHWTELKVGGNRVEVVPYTERPLSRPGEDGGILVVANTRPDRNGDAS